MFEYHIYPCIGCAEFESVGDCIEFFSNLCNFGIHIEAGFGYGTFCQILGQIYDSIDRFGVEHFGCFNYFAGRTDYGIELEITSNIHEVDKQFALIQTIELCVYLVEYFVFNAECVGNVSDIGHQFVNRRLSVGKIERVKRSADRIA